jgi:hypothetical protein
MTDNKGRELTDVLESDAKPWMQDLKKLVNGEIPEDFHNNRTPAWKLYSFVKGLTRKQYGKILAINRISRFHYMQLNGEKELLEDMGVDTSKKATAQRVREINKFLSDPMAYLDK